MPSAKEKKTGHPAHLALFSLHDEGPEINESKPE
jgi:hypothetical protein